MGLELAPFTEVSASSKLTAGLLSTAVVAPNQNGEDGEGGNPFQDGQMAECLHKLASVHNKYEIMKDALTGKLSRDPSLRLASDDLPLKLMDIGENARAKNAFY